jgi:hypothetical protein
MSAKKKNVAIVGVAACAACCAGPILAVLAAIGLGTVAGFGTFVVLIGAAVAAAVVLIRAADVPSRAYRAIRRNPCRSNSPTCGSDPEVR